MVGLKAVKAPAVTAYPFPATPVDLAVKVMSPLAGEFAVAVMTKLTVALALTGGRDIGSHYRRGGIRIARPILEVRARA